jgi:hypothetical protein
LRPIAVAATALACSGCFASLEVCVEGVSREPQPLALSAASLLAHAHSHNDYEHARPLEDALAAGFHSVEADVWFAGGRFEVSHLGISPKGTLEDLYLAPLQKHVDERGSVLGDGQPFDLWLDLKDAHPDLVSRLAALLERYPMLTSAYGGSISPGVVTVVLTGDAAMKESFVQLDPRRAFCDSNGFSPYDPPAQAAWTHYALDWTAYIEWNGSGQIPPAQSERLACIVNRAHALGRKVRFFNAPDRPEVWDAWIAHGADYLNTNDLAAMEARAQTIQR